MNSSLPDKELRHSSARFTREWGSKTDVCKFARFLTSKGKASSKEASPPWLEYVHKDEDFLTGGRESGVSEKRMPSKRPSVGTELAICTRVQIMSR